MVQGIDETRVAKGGPLVRPWLVERGSAGGSGGAVVVHTLVHLGTVLLGLLSVMQHR
jgi:hypothetical protein